MRKLSFTILLFLVIPFIGVACIYPGTGRFNKHVLLSGESGKNYSDSIEYKIVNRLDHSYGYDIYLHGRLVIHQPSIPCIQGNKGFSKRSDAKKVAEFVSQKIRKGEMPPTITLKEMKNLGVVY